MNTTTSTPVLTIERKPVLSSNIKAIGYDAASKQLDVEFSSGSVYRYSGVSPEAHASFISAPSIGSHFARQIRNQFSSVDLATLDTSEGGTPD